MDYSNYLKTLYDYEKNQVGTEEKSILLKLINNVDFSAQIGSYLKIERQEPARRYINCLQIIGTQTPLRKEGIDIKGNEKIPTH